MLEATHRAAEALRKLSSSRSAHTTIGAAATNTPTGSNVEILNDREEDLELPKVESAVVSDPDSGALARLQSQAAVILDIVEGADMPVTSQTIAAANQLEKNLSVALGKPSDRTEAKKSLLKR